jgi:hypothetical protein
MRSIDKINVKLEIAFTNIEINFENYVKIAAHQVNVQHDFMHHPGGGLKINSLCISIKCELTTSDPIKCERVAIGMFSAVEWKP